jgi:hypothetical protein
MRASVVCLALLAACRSGLDWKGSAVNGAPGGAGASGHDGGAGAAAGGAGGDAMPAGPLVDDAGDARDAARDEADQDDVATASGADVDEPDAAVAASDAPQTDEGNDDAGDDATSADAVDADQAADVDAVVRDGAGDTIVTDATVDAGGPGTGTWGSLVVTGTNVPAVFTPSFKPNRLPEWDRLIGGGITWTVSQATAASSSDKPAIELMLFLDKNDNPAKPSSTLTSPLNLQNQDHFAGGLTTGITVDKVAHKVTFQDAMVTSQDASQDAGAAWTAVLNGELYYSDYPALPGTTVTSAALGGCPPTDTHFGAAFGDIQCAFGTYRGYSNQGTICTVVVDGQAHTIRYTDVGVDRTIAFGADPTDAGLTSNLHTSATFSITILGAQDAIGFEFWPPATALGNPLFEVHLGYSPGPGSVQMNTCRLTLP